MLGIAPIASTPLVSLPGGGSVPSFDPPEFSGYDGGDDEAALYSAWLQQWVVNDELDGNCANLADGIEDPCPAMSPYEEEEAYQTRALIQAFQVSEEIGDPGSNVEEGIEDPVPPSAEELEPQFFWSLQQSWSADSEAGSLYLTPPDNGLQVAKIELASWVSPANDSLVIVKADAYAWLQAPNLLEFSKSDINAWLQAPDGLVIAKAELSAWLEYTGIVPSASISILW